MESLHDPQKWCHTTVNFTLPDIIGLFFKNIHVLTTDVPWCCCQVVQYMVSSDCKHSQLFVSVDEWSLHEYQFIFKTLCPVVNMVKFFLKLQYTPQATHFNNSNWGHNYVIIDGIVRSWQRKEKGWNMITPTRSLSLQWSPRWQEWSQIVYYESVTQPNFTKQNSLVLARHVRFTKSLKTRKWQIYFLHLVGLSNLLIHLFPYIVQQEMKREATWQWRSRSKEMQFWMLYFHHWIHIFT
jgi:hypothetical protein